MHESPRIRRLRNDLTALEKLRSESSAFEFQATGNPPHHYLITFKGKGLCRDRGKVKIVHCHRVEIKLGASYPRTIPELRWLTSVYHPNISEIGMVCLGGYGTHWVPSVQLDELCMMLWDMARYFNYDIRSPYNRDAALWVANQTSILFPTDSRPLRDLRVAQGRVEASDEKLKGKSTGSVGDSSGRSSRAGRPSTNASGTGWNSRSPVDRVRQFMERYARAIGEGSAPQPDLDATLVGPEPSTAAGPEPSTTPIDASSVAPNGENEPGNVVLNTPIGQANGYLGENERDGVVILEATTDVPVRPARQSEADDEIVFIE
jgi:ubiquitin-protein ligase